MIYEVMMGSGSNVFTAVDAVNGVLTQKNYTVLSSSGYGVTNVATKTTNYTITGVDDLILCDATTSNVTITLPLAASAPGKRVTIKRVDGVAGKNVYVVPTASDALELSYQLTLPSQLETVSLVSDGTASWFIVHSSAQVTRP